MKKLNLKIIHLKTIQVNWSVHCAADSIIFQYIIIIIIIIVIIIIIIIIIIVIIIIIIIII